ncbi:MAG TPA: MFS transporter [Solirubrobacteraceae bacterium]|nr:MFS transporter [Solirubrobacteraceae bacterium]
MSARELQRRFVLLRALRWLPLGLALPFLILLPQDRGLGLAEIGLVFGVHSAVAIVLEVPSGGLADAIGRRTTLLLGGGITVAALAAYAIATALPAFMAAAAGIATGRALLSGALEAWFVDALRLIDPEAVLHGPLAAGSTAEGIGSGTGAAIGGFLPLLATGLPEGGDATLVQLSAPLLGAAAAAVVYVLAVLRYVDEPPRVRAATWRDALRDTAIITRAGVSAAGRSRNVRIILTLALAVGIVMSITEVLWPPRLEDLVGRDASDFAPLFGLLTAAGMLAYSAGSASSTRIARRLDKRRSYAGS